MNSLFFLSNNSPGGMAAAVCRHVPGLAAMNGDEVVSSSVFF
jgi:hypothetical protein